VEKRGLSPNLKLIVRGGGRVSAMAEAAEVAGKTTSTAGAKARAFRKEFDGSRKAVSG